MRAGLDTSVVLRLLTGEPENLAMRAWQAVQDFRAEGGDILVSDIVVGEAYFALHHHYDVPKEEALTQLHRFLKSGEFVATGHAPTVLATPRLATANPGLLDRLIHAEYSEHTAEMWTFEKAASKLDRARIL